MNSVLTLKTWLDSGLGFVYPEACQICGHERSSASEGFVCASCRHKVHFIKPPFCHCCGLPYDGDITTEFQCANCHGVRLHFRFARSAVLAGPLMLDVIHHYKYNRALWFEPFLAGLLLREAVPELACESWDMIIPVPLHPAKRREREFNQAELLAGHLSRATGIPVNIRILQRILPTETQTHLSRKQRALNVRNAFSLRTGCELDGERIVLLDDVFTTGATTSACAKVLRSGGARDVCVWTVARGR